MDTLDIHGYPWTSMGIHGYPWISMDNHGCQPPPTTNQPASQSASQPAKRWIPQRLPIEDERCLHRGQVFRVRSPAATECRFKKVQSGSKRFEQVQRMCRFEPNRWITPNTPKRFASPKRFGSGSGFLDPPIHYGHVRPNRLKICMYDRVPCAVILETPKPPQFQPEL